MITIYTHPKPWISPFAELQKVAVESWKRFENVRIILLGDDEGTHEAALSLEIVHFPTVETNEWGTPLVSSIFQIIRDYTPSDSIACYINTDIVLDDTFIKTIRAVSANNTNEEWLLCGKRSDFEFKSGDQFPEILERAYAGQATDHGYEGIDYFVFPPQTFKFVYPFALGKFVWDQWLVGNAFRRGVRCIDCSKTIMAVHLNAPWYAGGSIVKDRDAVYNSEEAVRNRSFDWYQRTPLTGTTEYSDWSDIDGEVTFIKRDYLTEL